jgi:DoxX-like family
MTNITTKNLSLLYWSFTLIFAFFMLTDGIAGVLRVQAGVDAIVGLGYPIYLLTIVGTAKILGSIAIFQNKYKTIKEWAYAGFVFNSLGALGSRYFAGDTGFLLFFPIILLAYVLTSYYIWRKFESRKI